MEKLINQSAFFERYFIREEDFLTTGLNWEELERIYEDHLSNIPFLENNLALLFSIFIKLPKVHSVRYRVKDAEHLIEKIIRKKIKKPERNITFDTYIDEIDDIIGIRILHLFKDDWLVIHENITKDYNLKEKPKAYYRSGDADEYLSKYQNEGCVIEEHPSGYRSIHYIIQQKILSNKIACEVQVRTVFEEAWSEVDHKIRYPYDIDNPVFKQHLMILNRLAGSADEMSTYLVFLKKHLAILNTQAQQESDNQSTIIKQLKDEISSLKLNKRKQDSINKKIDGLDVEIRQSRNLGFNITSELPKSILEVKDSFRPAIDAISVNTNPSLTATGALKSAIDAISLGISNPSLTAADALKPSIDMVLSGIAKPSITVADSLKPSIDVTFSGITNPSLTATGALRSAIDAISLGITNPSLTAADALKPSIDMVLSGIAKPSITVADSLKPSIDVALSGIIKPSITAADVLKPSIDATS